ncbi:MAG: YraN family protein [Patescibacteria group bacterium]|nr:YraN family protein [Patescibacteria group bacterium]
MFHDKQLNIKIGKIGEDLACEYLKSNGYKIIDRNFRRPYGEIDIIATKSGNLIFFEVKALKMRQNNSASDVGAIAEDTLVPEDNLTASKLKKLRKICEMFTVKHSDLFNDNNGWQIDLLAIVISEESKGQPPVPSSGEYQSLTIKGKGCLIKHYENIG